MNHDELEHLLGAYALDATGPDEAREVEAHLAECPRCRAEVQAHQEVAALLAGAGGEAPSGLWEKIAARLDDARADAPAEAPAGPRLSIGPTPVDGDMGHHRQRTLGDEPGLVGPRRRRGLSRSVMVGAATALAAAAAATAVLGFQVANLHSQVDSLHSQLSHRDIADAAALVAAGPHQTITLQSGHRSVATMVVSRGGSAYWLSSSLAKLPPSETYQLWGLARGKVVSLGLEGPDPRSVGYFRLQAAITKVMVTAEPEGGTPVPTTSVLAAGDVPPLLG